MNPRIKIKNHLLYPKGVLKSQKENSPEKIRESKQREILSPSSHPPKPAPCRENPQIKTTSKKEMVFMVEDSGFEPLTPCVQSRCSTN